MKEIYSGKYLRICFEVDKNLFIQDWTISPQNIFDFKYEMTAYVEHYKKYKPIYTLWLQQNFTLNIDSQTQYWIEKNVNEPCLSYGNKKCAFIVSKDILAHISVIDSFDKIQSCILPKHFSSEENARKWIDDSEGFLEVSKEQKITYEGVDKDGFLLLKIPTKNINNTLKNLQNSIDHELFFQEKKYKLETLTKREKEILMLIVQGYKHQNISDKLFISLHTTRTHWKKIKSKLDFTEAELNIFLSSLKL